MSTCIIELFLSGEDSYEGRPSQILGPFTRQQAERIAATLTCEHFIRTINTTVPEWATT